MNFSKHIKQLNNQFKLPLEDMANELGVNFAIFNCWEKGNYISNRLAKKVFDEFSSNHDIIF